MDEELLKAYQLKTLNPQSWENDSDEVNPTNPILNKDINDEDNYALLLNIVNQDSDLQGVHNAVDPLNPNKTIAQVAHERSLGDSDLSKLSINSKQFNSKQFLKFIHKKDSFAELSESLNILEGSIVEKNKELRLLVEKEFLRFVRSKSSLDGILSQFQKTGFNDEEVGLKSLRGSVNEANKEATLLIKPILQKKQRELKLKQAVEFVEKKKFFFNLPKSFKNYISENDYDNLIHDYKHAKELKEDNNNRIVNRIWEDVEIIMDTYKQSLWQSLSREESDDDFLKNIKKLIELDVIDNPVLEWIDLKQKTFINLFNEVFGRYHEKILNVQLNILSTVDEEDFPNFKNALSSNRPLIDSTLVIEMWLMTVKLIERLKELSAEFIKFWNHVENFLNGTYQQRFVSNYIDINSPFLKLEKYEIEDVKKKGETFIDLLVNKLIRFFSSTRDSLKTLHTSKTNEKDGATDNFGFLPPYTNSLSSLKYLPKVYTSTSEILNSLGQLAISDKTVQSLRDTCVLMSERVVGAVCASWLSDCRSFHKLEDWESLGSGETLIPTLILDYEVYVIQGLEKLLFGKLPEAKVVQIVKYPSKRILTGVQIQFLRSFDVLLESMIKKIIEENQDDKVPKTLKSHHKLLTLSNIKKLTTSVIPSALEKFDKTFDDNLHTQNLEIYSILDKMEQTIFDSYINEQRKSISKILLHGISNTQWSSITSPPSKVSSFIYETVHLLIVVHTSVSKVSQKLIRKVLQDLLEYTSVNLLKDLREVGDFSVEGLRQVATDVEFLKKLIGKSASQATINNLNLIYKNVFGPKVDTKSILSSITPLLNDSLDGSRIEFDIFNN